MLFVFVEGPYAVLQKQYRQYKYTFWNFFTRVLEVYTLNNKWTSADPLEFQNHIRKGNRVKLLNLTIRLFLQIVF